MRASRPDGKWRRPALLGAFGLLLGALLLSLHAAAQAPASPTFGMRLIVVGSREEAEEIQDELARGRDFATLAKERSIDPTAPDGGALGRIDPATLRPELRDALVSVAIGNYTGVVRIPTGFAILKILADAEESPSFHDDNNPARVMAAAANGAVQITLPVAGLNEADAVFLGFAKPEGWNTDLRGMCEVRKQSLSTILQRLEQTPQTAADESPLDAMQGQYAWAQLHGYLGQMDQALERWHVAQQIVASKVPDAASMMLETLGLAHFHKSAMDNGVFSKPGELCLFPPHGNVTYPQTAGSEKAVEYFLKFLEEKPNDLEVRWLLNLAYMTLGKYPSGVPERYRIPLSGFESTTDIGRFPDVAARAGVNAFSLAGGAVIDTFENDGLLDVVTSSMDVCESLHYFKNKGDGTFVERTAQAGLAEQLGGLNLIQGDYNNDGCMDLLVLRGGWEFAMRKSLLRNNCNGTFTDVTRESGLWNSVSSTQTAVWADIDNDGWLDVFAGSENGPSQLFRNRGDGTFEDISRAARVDRSAFTKAVVAADYDKDGYIDFYLSNYNGANSLYHNNHDRTFTEVGKQAGVQAPWRSFAAWFFDYDNDGWPDIFVNSYYISNDESVRTYLGMPHNAETSRLYRNLGDGTFRDITAEVGLDKVLMPMAANFGDVNNDGYLDLYLGMGSPSFGSVFPHELLLNKQGKSFVSITASSGTGELHKGHGIAFADLDRDGDEDIVAEIGGAVPADRHALRLFRNPGQGNDWINVHLVGVKSNRSAIGAEITVTVDSAGDDNVRGKRTIVRTVGPGGSFGANPMEQHIGLGKAAEIQSLEVWWPATRTRQTFARIAKNQFVEIKESSNQFTKLDRKPVTLGGR
ncbi:MAG: FG-GAP-like repeat-containing protein [Acidobacteriota bacterium]